MSILRLLRKNIFINTLTRNILRKSENLTKNLCLRWRISGTVQLSFNEIMFKYYARCDDHIVDLLYYGNHYHETGELKLFLELSKKCNLIFDIGANTGLYSILSSLGNKHCKIIAFEPHPHNVVRLKKNISLNNISNVQIIEKALGDVIGDVDFTIPENDSIADTSSANGDFSRSTYEGKIKWKQIKVPQVTLDSLIIGLGDTKIDLIKLDVEGYEIEVLKGASRFFEKFSPIIFCEILLNEENKIFFDDFLVQTKYQPYLVLTDGLLRLDDGMIKNFDGLNYVFSKNKTPDTFTSFKKMDLLVNTL